MVSVVSRIPDKLLMVRQMTLKITTKKVGPNPYHKTTHEKSNLTLINKPRTRSVRHPWNGTMDIKFDYKLKKLA